MKEEPENWNLDIFIYILGTEISMPQTKVTCSSHF